MRCVRCGGLPDAKPDDHITDAELDALFGEPEAALDAFDVELQRRRESYTPSFIIKHRNRDEVDAYTDAMFSTAMEHVARKDWDGAIHHLRRVIDYNRDLTDAHLWLARLLPDEAERRAAYKAVLALDMSHGDALRELMILDGELDPENVPDDFTMPHVRQAGTVVAAAHGVKCPACGAPKLNTNPLYPGRLICGACGHDIPAPDTASGDRNVSRALLKKRAQTVEWVVGGRVLHCNGCGAERTFAAAQLAELCPFCGSRNVIAQDATGSLMQPDGVVTFALDEEAARDAVRKALSSGFERLKGWFTDNRAERLLAEPVYLPFWVFDATVNVMRTVKRHNDDKHRIGMVAVSPSMTFTEVFADAFYNILVPGVDQPPAWMLGRLGNFDVSSARAYGPALIAQHGAEIYTKPFDKASIDAHGIAGQAARQKYRVNTGSQTTISIFATVTPISYRLLLLPVWAITIRERDGDMRPALVNGQTGKVVFGKAVKQPI